MVIFTLELISMLMSTIFKINFCFNGLGIKKVSMCRGYYLQLFVGGYNVVFVAIMKNTYFYEIFQS